MHVPSEPTRAWVVWLVPSSRAVGIGVERAPVLLFRSGPACQRRVTPGHVFFRLAETEGVNV